jgi:hypothetical protein
MITIRKSNLLLGALLTLSALVNAFQGKAQTAGTDTAWSVVSSGGGGATVAFQGWGFQARFDSAIVTYTVGESCIADDHIDLGKIPLFDVTEGFQQPDGYGIKPYDAYNAIDSLLFYPNPCRQFSFVNFQLNESFTTVTLKVYDMRGIQTYTDSFVCGDGKVQYQLTTANLAPGMYIVEVVGFTNKRYIGKLMIIP